MSSRVEALTCDTCARRFAPGALSYLDEHFGHKLQAQHRAMAAEIQQLAREHGVSMPAFDRLVARATS